MVQDCIVLDVVLTWYGIKIKEVNYLSPLRSLTRDQNLENIFSPTPSCSREIGMGVVCYKFPRYTKSTFGTFGKIKGVGGPCSQILPKKRKMMIRYFPKVRQNRSKVPKHFLIFLKFSRWDPPTYAHGVRTDSTAPPHVLHVLKFTYLSL